MVRYCRGGGEAVLLAVRIARELRQKKILFFLVVIMDGLIGILQQISNEKGLDGQPMPWLEPNGVPRGLTGTSIPFELHDIDIVKNLIQRK